MNATVKVHQECFSFVLFYAAQLVRRLSSDDSPNLLTSSVSLPQFELKVKVPRQVLNRQPWILKLSLLASELVAWWLTG